MRSRELAALVVALLAVWQPSGARPQTSKGMTLVPVALPAPLGLPTSSAVEETDLISKGSSVLDAPAAPQSLPVDKRTGLTGNKEFPGFSGGDLGGSFGQNVPALSDAGLGAEFGKGSPGFSVKGPGSDLGAGSPGLSVGSGAGFGAGAGAGFGAGSGAGFGAGSGAGFGAGSGAGFGAGSGAGFGAGSGAGFGAGSGAGFGAGSGAGFGAGSGAGFGAGSGAGSGFSTGSGTDFGVELSAGADVGLGVGSPKVPLPSQGGLDIKVDDQSFSTSGIGPSKVPLPGTSKIGAVDSLLNHPKTSGGGALGKVISGHSSAGGGGVLNLLSSLITGLSGTGSLAHKNPLSALGLGSQTLQSFVQLASASADDIGRETNFGLRLLGDEVEFQGQQRLKKVLKGVQQAGRTVGAVGQNTYRGVLQTKDSLGNLAVGTVHNLGEFADHSVTASFDKVSDTLGAFGRLLHDLKTAFLKSIIAQAEAGKVLVDNQSKTTSGAVKEILDDNREVIRDNIRAITGLKKEISSKRI
ncbi:uncharacterized protein [Procambarus clarkii]|uniref:uncharacterized protein n=1 Tax=Procambarus clarkii TaxID=6728 RepID=UPI003743CCFD